MNSPLESPFTSSILALLRSPQTVIDLNLTVTDGTQTKTFPVHTRVLLHHSPSLQTILNNPTLTGNPNLFEKVLDILYGQNATFETWQEKIGTLIYLKFFQVNLDYEKEARKIDITPPDLPAYITMLNQLFDNQIPSIMFDFIGGVLQSNADLQYVPEAYHIKIILDSEDLLKIILHRIRQLATTKDGSIQYYRADHYEDNFNEGNDMDGIYIQANNQYRALLILYDRLRETYPNHKADFDDMFEETAYESLDNPSDIQSYDLTQMDNSINNFIEALDYGGDIYRYNLYEIEFHS